MAWAPLKLDTPLRHEAAVKTAQAAQGFALQGTSHVDKARNLLGICRAVIDGAADLVEFVDKNRPMARQMGIETIAIELGGIVDAGRLGDVHSLLQEGVKNGYPVAVSPDVEARLRRAKSLLADASTEIGKGLGTSATAAGAQAGAQLGADRGIGYFWVPFVALGVVAIGVAVYAYKTAPAAPKSRLPIAAQKLGSGVFLGSRYRKPLDNR